MNDEDILKGLKEDNNDSRFVEENLEELLNQYEGKIVAIKNKKLI